MTENRRVVVPFERPAAYWATRARRHYTPNRLPDAAKLMRKALEKSGDPAMAMELARIYGGMECHTAAERWLVRAIARSGLTGDACFLIGCCALNRGEETLAEQALDACLRLDPDGLYSQQAQHLLESYPWSPGNYPPRSARSETYCHRAQRSIVTRDLPQALLYAKKAWKKRATFQAALLLGALLPSPKALPYFFFAVRQKPLQYQPHLLLAQALYKIGRHREGRNHLLLARSLCETISQAENFCAVAWDAGQPQEALALASAHLEKSPASVDYLRLKYLSLQYMQEETAAQRTLQTLLDIDPDDAAGLWYRRHPENRSLFDGQRMLLAALGCQINALPPRLHPGPLNRILHLMVMMLADTLDAPMIYRLLPPLWKKLSGAEKKACDERRSLHYPLAFAMYLLLSANQAQKAREYFLSAPGKKRLIRTLKRFARLMNEE